MSGCLRGWDREAGSCAEGEGTRVVDVWSRFCFCVFCLLYICPKVYWGAVVRHMQKDLLSLVSFPCFFPLRIRNQKGRRCVDTQMRRGVRCKVFFWPWCDPCVPSEASKWRFGWCGLEGQVLLQALHAPVKEAILQSATTRPSMVIPIFRWSSKDISLKVDFQSEGPKGCLMA